MSRVMTTSRWMVLTYPDGTTETTTTDGNGFYEFTGLELDETYTVTVDTSTLPDSKDEGATGDDSLTGDQESEGTSTLTTTLTADSPSDPTLDFGYKPLGLIGSTLFHDMDGDGVYEPSQGEFPLEGIEVTLTDSSGTVLETVMTDQNGQYLFDNLPLDETYTVTVDTSTLPDSKWQGATGDDSLTNDETSEGVSVLTTTLTTDDPADLTLDFGYQPRGQIGDFIFHDSDGDGLYEPNDGDFPLEGVEVTLTASDGTTETATTDVNGEYLFEDLPFDDYTVEVDPATLPASKTPNPTSDPEDDGDNSSSVSLTPDNPSDLDQDFSYQPLGTLGTTLFHDVDADGVYEPNAGDFPLSGVDVTLTYPDGTTATMTTDGNGFYEFTDLPLNETYSVSVDTADLPVSKNPDATGDSTNTGDEESEGVVTLTTTLTDDGPDDPTLDFGFSPYGAIGDTIFHDRDGDGVYEPSQGEFPLEGVEVILTDSNGMTETATTDENGEYLFTGLEFGDYTVEVNGDTLPIDKAPVPTADPEGDENNTSSVTLTPEDPEDLDQDFGYQPLGALGSTIFHDINDDGVYDPTAGDFPLSDVLVTLTDGGGNTSTMLTDGNGFYQFTDLALDETYTVTVDTSTLPDTKDEEATGDSTNTGDEESEGVSQLTTTLTADEPNDQTLDFGYRPLGTLGTTIFHDADNDGVYEPSDGDFPLEGVVVTLEGSDGTMETTTTDELGNYQFTDLALDETYTVTVDATTLPESKQPDATGDDGLTADQTSEGTLVLTTTLTTDMPSDPTLDFGFQSKGTIGDFIFHDLDGDGMYEPNDGEFPLQGVEVTLTDEDGNEQTTTTDELGQYLFEDLEFGDYTVEVDETTLPDGKSLTPSSDPEGDDNNTSSVTLTPEEPDDLDQDFGYQPLGALGSLVFHDMDADGIYEPQEGDFPLDGVMVTLTDENGNTQTMTTDENGFYQFTDLPLDATYSVTVDTTALPDSKSPAPTGDDSLTADQTSEGVITLETTLTADEPNDQTLDFGFQPKGVIGDFIFHDADGDGMYEPNSGEFPLEGVMVTLTDEDGNVQTATTDELGHYLFEDLPLDATYTIAVDETTLPDGKSTDPTSDPEGDGDNTSTVTLTEENPSDLDQDFSYQPLGALGNTIWHDSDDDGVYEPADGEFPLEGVVVELTYPDGTTETTMTDENGFYQFTDLPLDATYSVTVDETTLPDSKAPGATGDSSLTADQTSEGTGTLTATLTADNPNDPTLDFGYQPLGQIGDFIFHDLDGDGMYEPNDGEFPLEGVLVTLTDEDGNEQTATTDELGQYLFTDLPLDETYTIEVDETTLPANKSTSPTSDPEDDGNNTSMVTLTDDNPSDLDQDFSYQPLGALGSLLFHDMDGDGVYEPSEGEFPLEGVTVTLTDEDGNTQTATTDELGFYQFTDLPLDETYTVTVDETTLPDSKAPGATGDSSLTDDQTSEGTSVLMTTLTADEPNDQTLDFGYQPLGQIGDFIFHDADGDGMYEPNSGEFPLEGVMVTLTDEDGNVQTATTDELGQYLFEELPLDETYTIEVDESTLPDGKSTAPTSDPEGDGNNTSMVTLTADNPSDLDQDFSYEPLGALGNTIWHDTDNDGVYEPDDGDRPLEGVVVTLTYPDGTTEQMTTDENGFYQFTDLPLDATYSVTVDTTSLPDDKLPGATGSSGLTVDQTSEGVITLETTLTADMPNDQTLDFGFTSEDAPEPLGTVGNTIFHDTDNDGVFEPGDGDRPIGSVIVTLTYPDGSTEMTTTDGNGNYLFTDLPLDETYSVTVDTSSLPNDKLPTATGSSDLTDDQTSEGVITLESTLTADMPNDGTADFGFTSGEPGPLGAVGDLVFHDVNDNGVYDDGDEPLPNTMVTLLDEDGMVLETQMTDENGRYLFDELPLGEAYTVRVDTSTLPDTKSPIPTNDGSDGDDTSDGSTSETSFMLTEEMTETLVLDFGFGPMPDGPTGTIGNLVFHDVNDNGVYDDGDEPLPDTAVTLTYTDEDGNPVALTTTTDENGQYEFSSLPLNTDYVVTVDNSTLPDGKATVPTDDGTDGDETSDGALMEEVTLTDAITEYVSADFGFGPEPTLPNDAIGDRVFHDLDGDGIYEPEMGDFPLEGVEVLLTMPDGTVRSETTDEDGLYNFANLPLGVYTIEYNGATLPIDKVGDPTTGLPAIEVTLTEDGPSEPTFAFGFQPVGVIGDLIFHDADGDGVYEPEEGDEPLEGVGVSLTLPDGSVITTTTDAAGNYLFTGLELGAYTVTVDTTTLPAEKLTDPTMGEDSVGANVVPVVLSEESPSDLEIDFGYIPELGLIDGMLFHDADNDGVYEPEEDDFVLEGVVMTLQTAMGDVMTTTTDSNGYYIFPNLPLDMLYTVSVDSNTLPMEKFSSATEGEDSVGGLAYVLFLSDEIDPSNLSEGVEPFVPFGFSEAEPTSIAVNNLSASTTNVTWLAIALVLLTGVIIGRKRKSS